jgi:tripartite-type tricarboxylate transporter receptor subunit TctC
MLANSTLPGLDQDFLDPTLKAGSYTPIARVYGDDPVVLLARKGSQYTNLAALKKASAAGQTITVGATQNVSGTRLAVALLAVSEHLKVSMVPFSTGTTAADAAIGGSVDLAVTLIPQAQQLDASGKTQAVVQFGPKADPSLPGVQAVGEIGLTADEVVQDSGLVGPPNMPADQVQVLQDALKQESASADFLQQIKTQALVSSFAAAPAWGKELDGFSATVSSRLSAIQPTWGDRGVDSKRSCAAAPAGRAATAGGWAAGAGAGRRDLGRGPRFRRLAARPLARGLRPRHPGRGRRLPGDRAALRGRRAPVPGGRRLPDGGAGGGGGEPQPGRLPPGQCLRADQRRRAAGGRGGRGASA